VGLGFKVERRYYARGLVRVVGIDEVGRGPLAGPVLAAAVLVPEGTRLIRGINDSKVLTHNRREKLAAVIRMRLKCAVGAASVREIDRLNIRRASALAMRRALDRLREQADVVVIDGLPLPELGCAHDALVDGDAECFAIACASIIAKTVRDRLMRLLAVRYPAYGWEKNAGYATADHLGAINREGVTPHHRRSFAPVVQVTATDLNGLPDGTTAAVQQQSGGVWSTIATGSLTNFTATSEGISTDTVIEKLIKETPSREGELTRDERFKKIFAS